VAELESLYELLTIHESRKRNCVERPDFQAENPVAVLRSASGFNCAFVGKDDRIIPPKNQLAFWEDRASVIDAGHFPFYRENRIYKWIE
jgi:hypothetical protein